MLHTMNRLARILCVLACLGCADEFPPLVPYVDLGPRPSEGSDMATSPGVDEGVRLDGGERLDRGDDVDRDSMVGLDMAPADDMSDPDIASMFDWATFDGMATADEGPIDGGSDGMGPDLDLGLDDMTAPDLDPLDQSPPEPDVRPPLPDRGPPLGGEACNGLDDDVDGLVDEEPVCGPVIVERCKVFLGFFDYWGSPGASNSYGACPQATTDPINPGALDYQGCVGTLNDHRFRRLRMAGGDVNDNDEIAFAFICDDDAIGRWFQRHCEVIFGQGDSGQGDQPASRDEWGPLDGQDAGRFRSIGTGGDGRFHAMSLLGDVGDDDTFAIAFRCDDPAQPERAAAAEQSAAVILGWADSDGGGADLSASWMDGCPAPDGTALAAGNGIGCAGSNFDGRFYRIELSGEADGNDHLGIALIPRPPRDLVEQPLP